MYLYMFVQKYVCVEKHLYGKTDRDSLLILQSVVFIWRICEAVYMRVCFLESCVDKH